MNTKLLSVLAIVVVMALAGCGGGGGALMVTSVTPAADATDVAVTTAITATFDRAIDESTLTTATFTLTGAGGLAVAGTVTYDAGTMTATFTPTYPLTNWMTYAATITTGVSTSLSLPTASTKASLSTDYTWQFTAMSRKILYASRRAPNGTDAAIVAGGTSNVWSIDVDGSNDTPLTSLVAADTQSGSPQWSPDGTRIAYDSRRALDGSDSANPNNTMNIWVMDADGSGATPLTSLTTVGNNTEDPQWSPDGSRILYQSGRALDGSDAANANNTANIWVIDADGSNSTPLTSLTAANANSGQAFWSPDGTKIAFASSRALDGSDAANINNTLNIWVMNADGSNPLPLTTITAATVTLFPRWSPDGTQIAFTSNRALDGSDNVNTNNMPNVWVMDADGSGATPLTSLTAAGSVTVLPEWSPDGTQISYTSVRALDGSDAANTNNTANIWMMDADGSNSTPLTSITALNASSSAQRWLQNGSSIVYISSRALDGSDAANTNDTPNVWSMGADGSSATPLTSLTALDANSADIAP